MPGERGRAVITNLHSYAMPIIRYEVGDICIPSQHDCSCGNELPLMSIVEGRIDDMVYTPGGKTVSPNSITNVMEAVSGISQFRVIQEKKNLLVIKYVRGSGYSSETSEQAKKLMYDLIGNEMEICMQIVEEIPREYTGKMRAVISKVSPGMI